jgi:predicted metal-dependent hydrolase
MKSNQPHRLVTLGQHQIKLHGRTIDFTLKQSPRIRGIRLEIHGESGLTVVVPKRHGQAQVHEILEKKSAWIFRHLPGESPMQMPLFRKQVDHGENVTFMGKPLEVVIVNTGERRDNVYLKGSKLLITSSADIDRARLLELWYRQQAARIFKEKADKFQQAMGLKYNRITIRGQRKRWASASPSGNLSINWKLLMAPEAIIDYVIMHELAHFKHMDHSRRFWGFLEKFCPDWRKKRKWLLTHEDELKSLPTFGR